MMRGTILFVVCAIFVAGVAGCAKHALRGKAIRSTDGKTYLVVDDNNGGGCRAVQIDGREWLHPVHSPGVIEPGVHKISCGDTAYFIKFEVTEGTIFHFDYWGP